MSAATADAVVAPVATGRRTRWRALRRPGPVVGLVIVGFWVLMAVGGWHLIAPQDPQAPVGTPLTGPSGSFLLGTDGLGRDVLSRVLAGASSVLAVAPAATALALLLGVAIGLTAGYRRGWVDLVVMRVTDVLLSFPVVITAVLAIALLGRSQLNVILVIAILFAPLIARTVRTATLVERERDYVTAARLRGEPGLSIAVREILPNITGPIVVEGTLRLGYAVFTSTTLAFLNLGVRDPSPDWGLTIAQQRATVQVAPLAVLAPAIALASLIIAVNLVAEALQEDPG